MSRWQTLPLGKSLTFQRGFDITKAEQQDGPYLVFSSSGAKSSHAEFKVRGPGVIIGRKGSLGTVFYSDGDFWPHDTTLWVKDFHGNYPAFAYYFLQTMGFERLDAGASNPTLNRNHIHTIPVRWPPVPTQRKIAAILSAYDDLIENNLRRIKILEEMAQKLYREWFVMFRFPGHQHTRFFDSPLGMIPEGWNLVKLGDELEIRKGKNITKKTITKGAVPVVAGGRSPAYYHSHANTSHPVVTISASGANAGFVSLYQEDIWASDCSYIDKDATPFVYFYYLFLKSKQVDITRLQRGSAQPHVYPKDLMELPTINIPRKSLEEFEQEAAMLFEMIRTLNNQNENLHRTRDLLLPKLISGEVDVSELDIAVLEETEE